MNKTKNIKRTIVSFEISIDSGSYVEIIGDNVCDSVACTNCDNGECFDLLGAGYGTTDGVFYVSWLGKDSNKD